MVAVWLVAALLVANNGMGREEFEQASKYFEAEEYELALPLFEKAYTLSGNRPSTTLALAQCERQLHLYAQALEHFREYRRSNPADAAKIDETIRLVEELKAHDEKKKAAASATPGQAKVPTRSPPPLPAKKLDAAPPPPAAPALVQTTGEADEATLLENPWLWVGVGGAVVVATVLSVVFATRSPDIYAGSTGEVIGPLRFGPGGSP